MPIIQPLIEDKINNLWKEFSDLDICKIPPIASQEIPDKGIVFIGMNPSLAKSDYDRLINRPDKSCDFYKLTYDENIDYRYFKKFFEVSQKTGLDWGHLDLLYCRETSQNKVKELLKTERGKDFLYQQCMITKLVLDELLNNDKPKIFVITNTFARDLLGKYRKPDEPINEKQWWVNYDFVWDDNLGTYTCKNTPFFFTSMLTGQRALDNGTFERLVWHINQVKKKTSIS